MAGRASPTGHIRPQAGRRARFGSVQHVVSTPATRAHTAPPCRATPAALQQYPCIGHAPCEENADVMSRTRLRATATAQTASGSSSGWMRRRSCTLA